MTGAGRHVYLGTSEFAVTVLRTLAAGGHAPALVVTPPDRRSGRGRKPRPPPAALAARELGLELHQTDDVNAEASRRRLLSVDPEVISVCAFGQLVEEPLLSALPMLNVHPSLLPRWRGAAPIERAIMAGDRRTGVCVIRLEQGLDSGPVAAREELAVDPGDDYGSLSRKLAVTGARLLAESIDRHGKGALELVEQPRVGITYAEKIAPAERLIDVSSAARAEALRVRALSPHIGAFVALSDDTRLGVRDVVGTAAGPAPGHFGVAELDDAVLLGLAEGALRINWLQPQGKRWMSAADYLRGYGVPRATAGSR